MEYSVIDQLIDIYNETKWVYTDILVEKFDLETINSLIDGGIISRIIDEHSDICYLETKYLHRYKNINQLV